MVSSQGAGSLTEIVHRQGFDEFMNVVMSDAEEVWTKEGGQRKELGEHGRKATLHVF